jgi:uncharacterized protein (TIGR02231 family)
MTELTTTIVAATIYPDRVRLTRRGSIKLKAGTHAIEIPGLPLSLNADSLRASVYGSASARLLGVQVKRIFYSDQPSDIVRNLEEEIEKKQDELNQLDAKVELIKQNRVILDKLAGQVATYATAFAAGEMTVEQQLVFFGKLRKQAEKLNDETLSIQINHRQVNRVLDRLTKELEQMQNARPYERYAAVIDVELLADSDLTIEVSYLVSGAGWKPLYDLRLLEKEGNSTLEISYLADVTQSTGEAWEDISLTLSTARPALTSTLPELEPWYIHPPEPIYPVTRLGVSPQALPAMEASAKLSMSIPAAHVEQLEEKAEEVTASVNTSGTSVSYVIPNPITVPPDGAPHKVTIARFPLTPFLDYVSTPKLAQAVFRRAKVDNTSPYTLLPGKANILIIDEFIGTTQLELTVPGEGIELYLGNDYRIKVERELKRREIDKRVISGRRHLAFGYEIKLESMLPGRANLTLYDQIPVPRNEDIKVKLESADPRPTDQTELNQLIWSLTLEPKEKRIVRFDFSVESPQAMKIIGLP